MADRVGQQLGNYRLITLLGQGGSAEVYLGQHIHLNTQAAIKLLQTHLANDADIEAFRAEARTIATLVHPHIVRVLDFGVQDGTPYLVMDLAPHGSLRQRLPRGTPLPPATILPYIRQTSQALQYAHDQKLVHRDVKPENMLLGSGDSILLTDFGIAMVAQTTGNQGPESIAGTVAYMAPEQLQGHARASSDQYALGVVAYEWLAGARPFEGSFAEVASQHLFTPPTSLCARVPTIPAAVEEVIVIALAKDPKARFGSVAAFATAFEEASKVAADVSSFSTQLQLAPVAAQPKSTPPAAPSGPGWQVTQVDTALLAAPTQVTPQPDAGPGIAAPGSGPSVWTPGMPPFAPGSGPSVWTPGTPPPAPGSGPSVWTPGTPPPAGYAQPYPGSGPTWAAQTPAPPPAPKQRRGGVITGVALLLVVVLVGSTLAGLGFAGIGPLGCFLAHRTPQFTVTSVYQMDNTPAGSSGTALHFSGQGFCANSNISFLLDGRPAPNTQSSPSDAAGNLRATLDISANWPLGTHILSAQDAGGHTPQSGQAVVIVTQGAAHTPGPNGSPPDDASFTINVTIHHMDTITGKQYTDFTHILIITGRPDPQGGMVCQSQDDGQTHSFAGTDDTGAAYTNYSIWTCQGSYKGGKLSYIETVTTNYSTYASGATCTSQTPFINEQLDGAFTSATTISGTFSKAGYSNTCQPSGRTQQYDPQSGTFTATISGGA